MTALGSTLPPSDDRATDPDLPPAGCRETWLPMAAEGDDAEETT